MSVVITPVCCDRGTSLLDVVKYNLVEIKLKHLLLNTMPVQGVPVY